MVPKKHAEEHFLNTHAPELCGNQTELCHLYNRYIRLRERYNHESRCNGIPEDNVGSSRYTCYNLQLESSSKSAFCTPKFAIFGYRRLKNSLLSIGYIVVPRASSLDNLCLMLHSG